eukprot:GHUV01032136.1.p1 GENE.GHUV01032136.1~~GHUV01032136.1.p1  ORF type:complete len:180 (+),score=19.83 GHUV01032136.1:425-964(+)
MSYSGKEILQYPNAAIQCDMFKSSQVQQQPGGPTCYLIVIQHDHLHTWCNPVVRQAPSQFVVTQVQKEHCRRCSGINWDSACQAVVAGTEHLHSSTHIDKAHFSRIRHLMVPGVETPNTLAGDAVAPAGTAPVRLLLLAQNACTQVDTQGPAKQDSSPRIQQIHMRLVFLATLRLLQHT